MAPSATATTIVNPTVLLSFDSNTVGLLPLHYSILTSLLMLMILLRLLLGLLLLLLLLAYNSIPLLYVHCFSHYILYHYCIITSNTNNIVQSPNSRITFLGMFKVHQQHTDWYVFGQ